MNENKELIRKIRDLFLDAKATKEAMMKTNKSNEDEPSKEVSKPDEASPQQLALYEIPKMNNVDIEKLESHIKNLEQLLAVQTERIKYLENMLDNSEKIELRPKSRQELPPMDDDKIK